MRHLQLILVTVFVLAWPWLGQAAIAYVQSTSAEVSSNVTTTSLQFTTQNCTAGSTLIVGVRWGSQGGNYTISDDTNGRWSGPDVTIQNGSNDTLQIWHFSNSQATNKATITLSQAVAHSIRFGIYEFTGLSNGFALDKTSSGTNTSTSLDSGSTATTSQANELFFGAGENNSNGETFTAGSNVAWILKETPPSNGNGKYAGEYFIASSAQAADAQFTIGVSDVWMAAVATYRDNSTPVPKNLKNMTVQGGLTVN